MNWQGKSAAELGRSIGAGEIDPVELTEYFISQKDPYNLVKNGELPSDLKR